MLHVLLLLALAASSTVAKHPLAWMYTDIKCNVPYEAPNEGKADWSKEARLDVKGCWNRKDDGAPDAVRRRAVWMPVGSVAACLTMYVEDDCEGHYKTIPVATGADHPLCYETDPGTDELAPDGYASYQFDMDGECGLAYITPSVGMPIW